MSAAYATALSTAPSSSPRVRHEAHADRAGVPSSVRRADHGDAGPQPARGGAYDAQHGAEPRPLGWIDVRARRLRDGFEARIEAGWNTANVDNLFELEEVFLADRLIADRLIADHGDLVALVSRVAHAAKRRGPRPVVGRSEAPEGEESVRPAVLDRIVARVVDDRLTELRDDRSPPRKKRRR